MRFQLEILNIFKKIMVKMEHLIVVCLLNNAPFLTVHSTTTPSSVVISN